MLSLLSPTLPHDRNEVNVSFPQSRPRSAACPRASPTAGTFRKRLEPSRRKWAEEQRRNKPRRPRRDDLERRGHAIINSYVLSRVSPCFVFFTPFSPWYVRRQRLLVGLLRNPLRAPSGRVGGEKKQQKKNTRAPSSRGVGGGES